MDAVITNNGTNTNVISGITVGTNVGVAVRGDRDLKHRLGKRLLSHRSFLAAATSMAASPPAMSMPVSVSPMRYLRPTECSSSRWQASAAFELPPAAWAALVIARAL
ncbi:MAG TPA: hypothetical protein VM510_05585 [Caulifigura sp.]|nr:hypothetical protein [Caulifigura sp.]